MTDRPRVTIVIPVFNGANYLAEAIDSALAQTYPEIEILVVNDGSDDGGRTEEIALAYGSRIRYVAKPNGGTATALNTGIENMTGEYLSWLSHDDLYAPEKVAAQVDVLRRTGDRDLVVYSGFDEIDERGDVLRTVIDPGRHEDTLLAIFQTAIHGCSLLIPRKCFDVVGLFDPASTSTQDNDMWLRMAQAGFRFHYLPVSLVKSRQHPQQGSRTLASHHGDIRTWYAEAIRSTDPGVLGRHAPAIAGVVVDRGHTGLVFGLLRRLLHGRQLGAAAAVVARLPRLLLGRVRALVGASAIGRWIRRALPRRARNRRGGSVVA